MKKNTYLITGGTGKTGKKVAERLTKLGEDIRIGSRTGTIPFDWYNSETWLKALEGIDKVYITFQPDLAIPGASDIIKKFSALAVKNEVKKLVLLSGKGEKEAENCEDIIKNSGADWTIVRASWFNQNFNEGFFIEPILAGHVALPKSEVPIPFVDTDDISDVVVETLLNDSYNGQTYELTGPRQLTFRESIEEISKASGKEIAFTPITIDTYASMLKEFQLPDDAIWLITYLFNEVLTKENSLITNDVEKVLGRKPKDFSDYITETVSTGVWTPACSLAENH